VYAFGQVSAHGIACHFKLICAPTKRGAGRRTRSDTSGFEQARAASDLLRTLAFEFVPFLKGCPDQGRLDQTTFTDYARQLQMMNSRRARSLGGLALWLTLSPPILVAQAPDTSRNGPAIMEWPGSCPTECCGYGAMWTAIKETRAVAAPLVPAAPTGTSAFTIPVGAVVRAITGTLYTLEAGAARVDEDFSTDATFTDFSTRHKQPITFSAGETITLLAARGNGVYRIEHDGRFVDANLYRVGTTESCAAAGAHCAGVVTKPPVTQWWVMVLNADKQAGWINDPGRFVRGPCR
jgi:hypothetical protein